MSNQSKTLTDKQDCILFLINELVKGYNDENGEISELNLRGQVEYYEYINDMHRDEVIDLVEQLQELGYLQRNYYPTEKGRDYLSGKEDIQEERSEPVVVEKEKPVNMMVVNFGGKHNQNFGDNGNIEHYENVKKANGVIGFLIELIGPAVMNKFGIKK